MGILFKRKNVTLITDLILVLTVATVAAVCFAPARSVPASGSAPFYSGSGRGGRISVAFNVYEGEDVVNGILDVLKEYGVHATFFMGGCFADDNEELLKRIAKEGHELGNHGYFHRDHAKLSYEKNVEEIDAAGRVIKALSGVNPTLFAPPSGSFNKQTVRAAESLGYSVVLWSKDTVDWRDEDADMVFKRATQGAAAGDIVLAHPKAHTLKALPKILGYYESNGLKQSTVSANLFGE